MMSKFKIYILINIFLFTATAASSKDIPEKIDIFLNKTFKNDEPGGVVLVSKGQNLIYHKAFGLADMVKKDPCRLNHKFSIGSITKQFTAVSILLLSERNLLSLNDNINKYLPDFPTYGKEITVKHLLNHTSGFFDFFDLPEFWDIYQEEILIPDALKKIEIKGLKHNPGDRHSYSGVNYILLGLIIEKITGAPVEEFFKKEIFEVLGMSSAQFIRNQNELIHAAKGYIENENSITDAGSVCMSFLYTAGALYVSAEDMSKWMMGLVTGKIIKKESLKLAWEKNVLNSGEKIQYGFAWNQTKQFGKISMEHGGSMVGYDAYDMYFPEDSIYIIVLTNTISMKGPGSGKYAAYPIAKKIAAIMTGNDNIKTEDIILNEIDLKKITGVYRAQDSSLRVIRLTKDELFWTNSKGKEFKIIPQSDSSFYFDYNNDHFIYFHFTENQVIDYLTLNVGNKLRYDRTHIPVYNKKKPIEISEEVYKKVCGQYKVKGIIKVDVYKENKKLIVETKMQGKSVFLPASDTSFFKEDEENVMITFQVVKNNRAEVFVLDLVDQKMTGKRIQKEDEQTSKEKQSIKQGLYISRIDHIVLMPENPKAFYNFLIKDLQLPSAWDFKNYGEFSSGGVSVGNLNLESYNNPNDSITTKSVITGIGFEPAINSSDLYLKLSKENINCIKLPSFEENNEKIWTNIVLPDLLPGSQIFSCEYHFPKEAIEYRRTELKEKLEKVNGGPLGIIELIEIYISVKEIKSSIKTWKNLLQPLKTHKKNRIKFPDGLTLIFFESENNQISSLRFSVQSLEKVRTYLNQTNIPFRERKGTISIDETNFGFNVMFSE